MTEHKRRNKFVLTFMGGKDVVPDERLMFEGLMLRAWPDVDMEQVRTVRRLLDEWTEYIVEVYYRPNTEYVVVHIYDLDAWALDEGPKPSVFHTKIDRSGRYS